MCIIIYKPENMTLNENTLQNSWNNNPNGAGFMYAENNKLHIVKGLMTYEEFKTAYDPHKEKQCVIHFRIATHGLTNKENTHPFLINKNLGLVHNGIIHKLSCNINTDMSDTWHLVEKLMKPLPGINKLWKLDSYQTLIEDYIGASKLVFMDNLGNTAIYNENLGNWNSECWFSNYSYQIQEWKQPKTKQPKQEYLPNHHPNTRIINPMEDTDLIKNLLIGDFVQLYFAEDALPFIGCNPNEVIPAKTKMEVKQILGQHRILVENPINNLQCYVSLWRLQTWKEPIPLIPKIWTQQDINNWHNFTIGQEVVFAKNYNHFRIGNIEKIKLLTKNFVIIETKSAGSVQPKCYSIPKHCLRPSTTLLM
jgi:predicted glutamine amidotransferase